jgi:hypothetical protein
MRSLITVLTGVALICSACGKDGGGSQGVSFRASTPSTLSERCSQSPQGYPYTSFDFDPQACKNVGPANGQPADTYLPVVYAGTNGKGMVNCFHKSFLEGVYAGTVHEECGSEYQYKFPPYAEASCGTEIVAYGQTYKMCFN